ncbi:hypothetical protein CXB51_033214 [Gossypium anomalum]|uniref:Uncharacterized protein n=1 Tax=Gossypium anomalum TaxID=47600 RepID=A0A8J5YAX8_9ROSI|nr:hypothetical protein CXB51_033214 [Gossypium anomalum]
MGGCASKPKEFDTTAGAPMKPEKSKPDTAANDDANGGEKKTEKDISDSKEGESSSAEPEKDEGKSESKNDDDEDDKVKASGEPVKKDEVEHDGASSKEEAKTN